MLDTALEAAKAGGKLATKYSHNIPKIVYKADNSPVTEADIETEKLIRKIISNKYPDHGFIGEELKPTNTNAEYKWIIDPIDGTRDFIRKIPYWAVMIALLKNDIPILGVIYLPAIKTMIHGQKTKGSFINGKKVKLSKTRNLQKAHISFGSLKRFHTIGAMHTYDSLLKSVSYARSYGNLGIIYLLEGKCDALIEPYGGIHDFAASAAIIEEAGGKFSDWRGQLDPNSGNAIQSNGLIHEEVLKILNSKK